MNIKTFDIKGFIDGHESSIIDERNDRRKQTNEVFTPFEIIERMCEMVPDESWADPEKIFLEPTFGNGNIVLYILWRRMAAGVDWQTAVKTLYGIELMQDNVKECKERVLEMLRRMEVAFDEAEVKSIMERNLVCADFMEWDFHNWEPYSGKDQENDSGSIPLF